MQPVSRDTAAKTVAVFDAPAMTVKAARHVINQGAAYALGGRGPDAFDGYGFVRHCIKVVFDARQLVLDEDPVELPDRPRATYRSVIPPRGLTPADAVPVEPDARDLEKVCLAAGMEVVPGRYAAVTQPGDVALSLGYGPAGAIVINTGGGAVRDWSAMAWDAAPEIRDDFAQGRQRVRVYRWPSPAVSS